MNNITDLLDLEDSDIKKFQTLLLKVKPKRLLSKLHLLPAIVQSVGFACTRGVKKRTINHPILQDGYSLILLYSNSAAGVVPIQTVCMKLMNPSALLTRDVELQMQLTCSL